MSSLRCYELLLYNICQDSSYPSTYTIRSHPSLQFLVSKLLITRTWKHTSILYTKAEYSVASRGGETKSAHDTMVFVTSLEEKMKQRNQERQGQKVNVGIADEPSDVIHVRILESEAILLLLQSSFHGLQRREGDKT